jgi:hypothetical protein
MPKKPNPTFWWAMGVVFIVCAAIDWASGRRNEVPGTVACAFVCFGVSSIHELFRDQGRA